MDTTALVDALGQTQNILMVAVFGLLLVLFIGRNVPLSQWGGPFISFGILGTFVGIMLALLAFDTTDIDASVPALLDGMKTAFLSSVIGMTVAVGTKVADLLRQREDGPSGPSGEDFIKVMREQRDALTMLQKSIGGDGDHSLLTQVRLANGSVTALKSETQGMRKDLDAFMAAMSKQSTKAIIEALRQVIRDFNSQLNEQFGDNFKQLNQGVERLVGWMEVHQKLVTESHRALTAATTNLEAATTALTTSATSLTSVEAQTQRVHVHITNTAKALAFMRQKLEALAGGATTLAESTKDLHGAVERLTTANTALEGSLSAWNTLAGTSGDATEQITGLVQTVEQHASSLWSQHEALVGNLRTQTSQLALDLNSAQKEHFRQQDAALTSAVRRQGETLQQAHREVMDQTRSQLEAAGNKNLAAIEQQVQALDQALEEELTKALSAMGGKLASLSEKFATDYLPLTEKLARVVRLAEDIERQKRGLGRG